MKSLKVALAGTFVLTAVGVLNGAGCSSSSDNPGTGGGGAGGVSTETGGGGSSGGAGGTTAGGGGSGGSGGSEAGPAQGIKFCPANDDKSCPANCVSAGAPGSGVCFYKDDATKHVMCAANDCTAGVALTFGATSGCAGAAKDKCAVCFGNQCIAKNQPGIISAECPDRDNPYAPKGLAPPNKGCCAPTGECLAQEDLIGFGCFDYGGAIFDQGGQHVACDPVTGKVIPGGVDGGKDGSADATPADTGAVDSAADASGG